MKNISALVVAAFVGMVSFAPVAMATTITEPFALNFVNGSGSLVNATVTTTTPSGSFGNTLTLTEDFQSSSAPGVLSGFVFDLIGGPGGSTEYNVTKTVINNTGTVWNGFLIGVGCNNGFMPCSPSGFGGGVDIDYSLVPTPTISVPGSLDSALPYLLRWSGMNVGNGEQVEFNFGIKTFDCGPGACRANWQIVETPNVVPEPSTYLLFGTGLLGIFGYARLRRQQCAQS